MTASRASSQRPRLGGRVDPAFRRVGETFAACLAEAELGAAVAVVVDGRMVVDLHGGYADRRRTRPWGRDTLTCVFSATKGVAALTVLDAVAEGALDLDQPVVAHWPAFAGEGRERVTLRQVLAHRAGMCGWRPDSGLVEADLYTPRRMAAALATEAPFWSPGTAHGYHARSFGFLLDELLLRATGEDIADRFARRFAAPLELDLRIGLDEEAQARCAELAPAPAGTGIPDASRAMLAAMTDASTVTGAAFGVPATSRGAANSAAWRGARMPAMNGHATARALATLYGTLASDGKAALLPRSLMDDALRVHSDGDDRVLLQHSTFGLGFMLSRGTLRLGIADTSFGHAGAGGSLAFGDREARCGFAFVMNRMRPGAVTGNASAMALVDAVAEYLA